jgi:hypothetical protein
MIRQVMIDKKTFETAIIASREERQLKEIDRHPLET